MQVQDFEKILSKDYSKEDIKRIIDGSKKRYVSLRVNSIKSSKEKVMNIFLDNDINFKEVSWFKDALIILNKDEKFIKELDIYKNGEIYLQSLSSMIPGLVIDPQENESILDMTAAPGGKTTEMAAITNNKAMITAVEKNKIRSERLKYNIEKLGAKKIVVLQEDARYLDENYCFDKILLDAPCSGSGTLIINNDTILNKFDLELIKKSINTQEELLEKALKMLKKGQELVYSTCSILKDENENLINKFIKNYNLEVIPIDGDVFRDVPKLPVNIEGALVVCPNEYFEGFFVVRLKI